MSIRMTEKEIASKVNTDPEFAVKFVVENNPNKILEGLRSMGYNVEHPSTNPEEAIDTILDLLDEASEDQEAAKDVAALLTSFEYNNAQNNWTGGLEEYLNFKALPEVSGRKVGGSAMRTFSSEDDSSNTGDLIGGIGSAVGSLGDTVCLYLDSCDASQLQPNVNVNQQKSSGMPSWVWWLMGLGAATLLTVILYLAGVFGGKKGGRRKAKPAKAA